MVVKYIVTWTFKYELLGNNEDFFLTKFWITKYECEIIEWFWDRYEKSKIKYR